MAGLQGDWKTEWWLAWNSAVGRNLCSGTPSLVNIDSVASLPVVTGSPSSDCPTAGPAGLGQAVIIAPPLAVLVVHLDATFLPSWARSRGTKTTSSETILSAWPHACAVRFC